MHTLPPDSDGDGLGDGDGFGERLRWRIAPPEPVVRTGCEFGSFVRMQCANAWHVGQNAGALSQSAVCWMTSKQ